MARATASTTATGTSLENARKVAAEHFRAFFGDRSWVITATSAKAVRRSSDSDDVERWIVGFEAAELGDPL